MKSLVQQSFWSIIMSVASVVVGFTLSVITARLLGPSGRGSYSLALLVMGTAGFFFNPGLYAAANYYGGSGKMDRNDLFQVAAVLSLPFALLAGAIALTAYLLLIFLRLGELHVDSFQMAALVGAGASAIAFSSTMSGVLFGRKLAKSVSVILIVSALLQIAAALLLVYTLEKPTAKVFVALFVFAQLFEAAARTFVAGRGSLDQISVTKENCRQFLQYGFRVHVSRTLLVAMQRVNPYLVYLLAGQAALGIYSIATMIADQLWLVPTAVSLIMMANIAYLDDNKAARITTHVSQTVFLLALMAAIAMGIIGSAFIPIVYGSDFSASIAPLLLLLPGLVAISVYPILEPLFQSRLKPKIPAIITGSSLALNIVLSSLMIPRFGIQGAAAVVSISYLFMTLLTCIGYHRLTRRPLLEPLDIFSAGSQIIAQLQSAIALRHNRATADQ